jgi:hypothetical protein
VAQATPTLSEIRPSRLTDWIDHLNRRKIAAKKARATVKRRRAITEQRLAKADAIIKEIVESGDLLGQRTAVTEDWPVPVTFVLLALEPWAFRELCHYGAELEDAEDTHDSEPTEADHGEMALGWSTSPAQHLHGLAEESEPSLGSLGMTDQRRWTEGSAVPYGNDLELDRADDEPSIGEDTPELDPCDLGEQKEYLRAPDEAIIEEARSRFEAATGSKVVAWPSHDPENGKPGVWLLQRPRGGVQ